MRVEFGEFVLDLESRELRRADEPVHLSPKAYQLLAALVSRRPAALSKSELLARLWPDTFVVEANLSNLVGELREALDEDSRKPRFLRTVQRFGYAFRGDEPRRAASTAKPSCRLIWSGGKADLAEGELVLGRDHDLELCFDSASVSRRHARIQVTEGGAVLEDLNSKNGTFVGGRRIDSPVPLADGHDFILGSVLVTYRCIRQAASTRTTRPPKAR